MADFVLDRRLERDSCFVGRLPLCQLRLINDSRWCWLLLVPMRDGLVEIHDLTSGDHNMLAGETADVSKRLKQLTGAEKINTGALGNIVRQLHIHVVARSVGDHNWPGPIWGYGASVHYEKDAAEKLISRLQGRLDDRFL